MFKMTEQAPYCCYPNVRKAVMDIHKAIPQQKGKRFTLRPWNPYKPENTLWWITPSTTWPAYNHGKITVFKQDSGEIFFGLNVEKGLDAKAMASFLSRKGHSFIMSHEWCWHSFIKDMGNGKVQAALDLICQNASGLPAYLEISGGVVDDPKLFDPYSSSLPWDKAIWKYYGGALKCIVQPERFLYALEGLAEIKQLPEKLEQIEGYGWIWIDIYIGINLPNYNDMAEETGETWNGHELWQNVLKHWSPWLV